MTLPSSPSQQFRRSPVHLLTAAVVGFTSSLAAGCALDDDAPPRDEPLACDRATTTRAFRIDAIETMSSSTEVDRAGLDLDGDGVADNLAGNVLAAMFQGFADRAAEAAWADQLAARLDGELAWIVEVTTCAGRPDGAAQVTLRRASAIDASTVWLDGDPGIRAAGVAIAGRVSAAGGRGDVPVGALAAFTGDAPDGWHPAEATAFDLVITDGAVDGRIAGGLVPGYADVVAASFLPFINPLIATGDTVFGVEADADGDGALTVAELVAHRAFRVLMTPDLDLHDPDGRYDPGADGRNDALSFGLVIHATEVASEQDLPDDRR